MATTERSLEELEQEAIDALASGGRRTRSKVLYSALGALSFIGIWAYFSTVFEPYVLPSPLATAEQMWELIRTGVVFTNFASSFLKTMAGWAMALALGIPIGLLMGRAGLREEKKRQVQQRRTQARIAARRYCDDISFVISKDSRDTLRRINRQLRDHYAARAEELNRSSAEALRAANEAAHRSSGERERRLKDVVAELARLRELRRRAETVLTPARSPAAPPVPTARATP
jgi:uncharacterized membrane-anchored protein YhcB (DUF1043 family)